MGKFRAFMTRFMYGRYGVDRLYTGLFILFLIVTVIDLFVSNPIISIVLSVLNLLIFLFMFYRVFSRKIYQRRKEETTYLKITGAIKKPFIMFGRRFKDRKTHIYKKCPSCKAQLRFPKRKGTIMVTCPKCKESFRIKYK